VLRVLDEDAEHILIGRKGDGLGEAKEEGEEKCQGLGYPSQPFLEGVGDISEVEAHYGGAENGKDGDVANRLEGEMEEKDTEDEVYNPYGSGKKEGEKEGKNEHLKWQHIEIVEIGGEPFHDDILNLFPADEV